MNNDWMRGTEHLSSSNVAQASLLWRAIEREFFDKKKTKPFDPVVSDASPKFRYLTSQSRPHRFPIFDGHSRFQADPETVKETFGTGINLGPVETDLLSFVANTNPMLGVLMGGMGSGKSTTLRFIKETFLREHVAILCNFDANLHASLSQSPGTEQGNIAEVLCSILGRELGALIPAEEEFGALWTWALTTLADSPGKYLLSGAYDELRRVLGPNACSESDIALAIRKKCHAELQDNPIDNLTYQALRIDYYLTHKCDGNRSRFILIIDNVDPLPPKSQFQMRELAMRLQSIARCKVLLALRPLTYSSNMQAANALVEVIEHIGPPIVDFIKSRVDDIIKLDMPRLQVRFHDANRVECLIGQEEAKQWLQEVIDALGRDRGHSQYPGEPNARVFVDGVCSYSLRSALVVAPKIFASSVIPVVETIYGGGNSRNKQRVRDHDVIRAILDGTRGYFRFDNGRATDNVFDLGPAATPSCTCKVRLLKRLVASESGRLTLGELRAHLVRFGYSDQVIRDAINSVISQSKRLAWSDSVAHYNELDGLQNTQLLISHAGRFYIGYAMFNLEYVQGVHIDVLLPREFTYQHDPSNFKDRIRSLELFVRHLYATDLAEVKRVLLSNASDEYYSVYGPHLFSVEMISGLERQITNVGRSLMRNQYNRDYEEGIGRWSDLLLKVQEESKGITARLEERHSNRKGSAA